GPGARGNGSLPRGADPQVEVPVVLGAEDGGDRVPLPVLGRTPHAGLRAASSLLPRLTYLFVRSARSSLRLPLSPAAGGVRSLDIHGAAGGGCGRARCTFARVRGPALGCGCLRVASIVFTESIGVHGTAGRPFGGGPLPSGAREPQRRT